VETVKLTKLAEFAAAEKLRLADLVK